MKAIWNHTLLAESGQTILIEGNHYFPATSIKQQYFRTSDTTSNCPWKGTANYFDIVVDDDINKDAAWYYATPKPAANEIKGHIAFSCRLTASVKTYYINLLINFTLCRLFTTTS